MTVIDYIDHLTKFYQLSSNRGWCFVNIEKGNFLTLKSSETNFTHHPFIFFKMPKLCLISPKLADENLRKLRILRSEFDSLKMFGFTRFGKYLKIKLYCEDGTLFKTRTIKIYSFGNIISSLVKKLLPTV